MARVKLGGHFIDEQTIRNRFAISRENLMLAIDVCDEIFIYDNSGEHPILAFDIANKQFMQISDALEAWCETLKSDLLSAGFEYVAN